MLCNMKEAQKRIEWYPAIYLFIYNFFTVGDTNTNIAMRLTNANKVKKKKKNFVQISLREKN